MNNYYRFRDVLKYLTIMVMVMLAMYVSKGTGFLIVVPLLFIPLAKGDVVKLFFYLIVVVAMLVGNSYLMPKNMVFAIAQRSLMVVLGGIMTLRCFGHRNSPYVAPLLGLSFYLLSVAVSSLSGWNPIISFMKLFLFTMVFFSYYGVCNQIATNPNQSVMIGLRSVFLALAIFFIVGSVLLIPFPGISQLTGDEFEEAIKSGKIVTSLFKGMTMHSQSLGPVVVTIFIVLLGDLIFSIRKSDRLYLLLILLCPILIVKTSSRTAMGGLLFGVALLMLHVFRAKGIRSGWRVKVINAMLTIVIVASLFTLLFSSVRQGISNFALKKQDVDKDDVTFEQIAITRMGKWEEGVYHFKQSPFIGNGFQVSEDMVGMRGGLSVLSAPVEKSIWITAVLEEAGVMGFIIFLVYIMNVVIKGRRNRCYIGNTTFLTMLVLNLGEFTYFSMSYTGGFQWAMVFVAYAFDAQRIQMLAAERQRNFIWSWR